MFADKFGWSPQEVRDLELDDYEMLKYAIDEVNKEQEKQNKEQSRGGSSSNGQSNKISSMADLIQHAESRRDCEVVRKDESRLD